MGIVLDLRADLSENVKYDYTDYFAYIKKGILSDYPNYTATSHWHDDIELISVLSGEMDYNINGEIVTLHANEGLFVNARQIHYGFSESRSECQFLCILLHPLLLCLTKQIEQAYIAPVIANTNFTHQVLHPNCEWENHILEIIHTLYFHLDDQAPQLHIQSLFYQLWLELYRNMPKTLQPRSYQKSHQLSCMKDMMEYIQEHYREKLSLNDISLSGNVCKSKCCSLFRHYLNQSPVDYLISYRLQKSLELLTSTDMNITEIAYEVGFSGTSYYIETFRKRYDTTPLEYRSQHAKKEAGSSQLPF